MNKKLQKLWLSVVAIFVLGFIYNESPVSAQKFNDVPATSPHAQDIARLVDMGVINGYGNGKFGMKDSIKREHAMKMIYAILKDDLKPERTYKAFSDVPTTHANYAVIKWGYEVGIIDGSNGKFNPSKFITRAEMAKILVTAFDLTTSDKITFSDVKATNWAYPYVNILASKGITQISNGKYNPSKPTERGQMASFLIRTIDNKNGIPQEIVGTTPVENDGEPISQMPVAPAVTYYDSGFNLQWAVEEGDKTLQFTGYSNNEVVGHYVRGAGKSLQGISIGMTRAQVISAKSGKFTNIISYKDGNYRLEMETDPAKTKEKVIFKENGYITTVFLDNFQNDKVVGILSLKESKYKEKNYYYASSTKLRDDFEKLMTIIINQTRKEFGLATVNYTPEWNTIARKHSQDMIDRNYFAHNSPDGKGLADRFKAGGLKYTSGGENISYGHETVIHSHEAFMNSEGHRKNILNAKHKNVFVGVAFSHGTSKSTLNTPYFTINFFTQ